MCGRYVSRDDAAIEREFNLTRGGSRDLFAGRFNSAPTQLLPVIRIDRDNGIRELEHLRWGLIPHWAKDAAIGNSLINARAETVATKPAFRAAFGRKRCLVPMAGYYEWKKTVAGNVPHFIHLMNADQFAVAGLHEWWPGRGGAAPIESFTIITTSANDLMATLHDRMPVILHQRDYGAWLDPANGNAAELQKLLAPYPSEEMRAYPVTTMVNSPKNEGPELLEPAPG